MTTTTSSPLKMVRITTVVSMLAAGVCTHPVVGFSTPPIANNLQRRHVSNYMSSDGFLEGAQLEAYERKNASRRKFGLNPISIEEFLSIEAQVAQLESEVKSKAAVSSAATAEVSKNNGRDGNIFKKFFNDVLGDTCDSNWDCERPKVCCDMGYRKMCCSSGRGIVDGVPVDKYMQKQLQPIPIKIPQDDFGGNTY
eukprot:CAMPEP_0185729336 /NCGR_PEP_ID=MMETSP1171-20130828/5150_1 /TAXON_ID=374046 /ORGANISM="Helicotheca tamensis, Strain CCMP826" /LENGTH=195 /DNA_ID=CAMNT_0028398147 /DNA_START=95 /DNA_END=682 /DNA_ORIENTATION=-